MNELVNLIVAVGATKGVDAGRIGADDLGAPSRASGFSSAFLKDCVFLGIAAIDLSKLRSRGPRAGEHAYV